MGHLEHAALGGLTPALSYVMACTGAALGLRCTVRALAATGRSRRNWLVSGAVAALQAERAAAVRHATDPSAVPAGEPDDLAGRTDRAVARLRLGKDNTVADSEELPAGVALRLEEFVTAAEQLRPLRTAVRERGAGWAETYGRYTRTIAAAYGVGGALTGIQDADLGSDARVLREFARAGEALIEGLRAL